MSLPKLCSASQIFAYLDVEFYGHLEKFFEKWLLTLLLDLKRVNWLY